MVRNKLQGSGKGCVVNKTRNKILCSRLEIASGFSGRLLGLMFRKSLPRGAGLLMLSSRESREGIWTFGMRFSIDVAWLDSRGRLVHLVEDFKPWRRPRYPGKKAKMVLEVNSGVFKKTGTKKGDLLKINL